MKYSPKEGREEKAWEFYYKNRSTIENERIEQYLQGRKFPKNLVRVDPLGAQATMDFLFSDHLPDDAGEIEDSSEVTSDDDSIFTNRSTSTNHNNIGEETTDPDLTEAKFGRDGVDNPKFDPTARDKNVINPLTNKPGVKGDLLTLPTPTERVENNGL